MKKGLVVIAALTLASLPAFSQWRIDLGLDVLKGLCPASGGTTLGDTLASWPAIPLPLPDVGVHYQLSFGIVNVGLGIRGFPLIVESMAWPNAFAELELGAVTLEAQVGAGLFAAVGLSNSLVLGRVLIPDLSAWFKIGRTDAFKLGGGIIGLYVPDALGSTMPFLVYLGGKAILQL